MWWGCGGAAQTGGAGSDLGDDHIVHVEAGAFHEEPVHVRALVGLRRDVCRAEHHHVRVHEHRVERQPLGARGHLQANGAGMKRYYSSIVLSYYSRIIVVHERRVQRQPLGANGHLHV